MRNLSDLAIYQRRPSNIFIEQVQKLMESPGIILEIGSDLKCDVLQFIADNLNCFSIGIDKSPNFGKGVEHDKVLAIQAVGESLPLEDNCIDAVISIATMEHVNDVPGFLNEIYRVLRPGGIFYTDFGPIWSCAVGHHVFAQCDGKEARFWKEGRNPIPDYSHLIMTKQEMQTFLMEGPCDDRLIVPMIEWIYDRNVINRHFFEDYENFFSASNFISEFIRGRTRLEQKPTIECMNKLMERYGRKDFTSAYLEALCFKPGKYLPQTLNFISKYEALEGIMKCPVSGGMLHYSKELGGYISESIGALFPVVDGIPRILREAIKELKDDL